MADEPAPKPQEGFEKYIGPAALIGGAGLLVYAFSQKKAEAKKKSKSCGHADVELQYSDLIDEGLVVINESYYRWQTLFMPSDSKGNPLPKEDYCDDPVPYVGLVQTPSSEEYSIVAESDTAAGARQGAISFIEQYR